MREVVKEKADAPARFFEAEAAGLRWLGEAEERGGARVARVIEVAAGRIRLERVATAPAKVDASQVDEDDRPAVDPEIARVLEVGLRQVLEVGNELRVVGAPEVAEASGRLVEDRVLELPRVGVLEYVIADRHVGEAVRPPPAQSPEVDRAASALGDVVGDDARIAAVVDA